MKNRPNNNFVLDSMRDSDMGDPWGTAMAWGFACAENLAYWGEPVPGEVGYRQSPMGPVIESYEDEIVFQHINSAMYGTAYETAINDTQFALKCLSRYIGWCVAAGKDY